MPSLRKRVSTYFRQLSFHNEPRQKRNNINENAFVTKYLQGHISLREGPPIIYGKIPTDLPSYELAKYETGYDSILSCYSGPNGGLTTIRRVEKHLSVPNSDDFDFIDTQEEIVQPTLPKKSPKRTPGQPVDNTKMVIKVAGQEYCVKNDTKKHKKSQSLGSISDFNIEIEKTKIDKEFYDETTVNNQIKNGNNNNNVNIECKNFNTGENSRIYLEKINIPPNMKSKEKSEVMKTETKQKGRRDSKRTNKPDKDHVIKYRPPKMQKSENAAKKEPTTSKSNPQNRNAQRNFELGKSKSEGNPFRHKGAKKTVDRPKCAGAQSQANPIPTVVIDDSNLPHEWNRKSDLVFGISDSLYDTNLVTKIKNGDPIADCFGVIAREHSTILAVADGVNWGEKACIAAKSAIHGCLHYLNKTIFNDTKLFENLTVLPDHQTASLTTTEPLTPISNTREVFVCLLRAFNCAHDLILENDGMLTTLTVAVVLPLSKTSKRAGHKRDNDRREELEEEDQYVCCVCNVGDTLAYIYSSKYGVRELTKGSHDINSNRDMRDALGALGPVDGINPELSNLTLSVTTLNKGDIVMVASDGLTDNFDPHVCKFTVNTTAKPNPTENKGATKKPVDIAMKQPNSVVTAPVKPPRRSHLKKEDRASSVDSKDSKTSSESANAQQNNSKQTNSDHEPTKNSNNSDVDELMDNPLIAHFMKQNSVEENGKIEETASSTKENKTNSLRKQVSMEKRPEIPSTSQISRNPRQQQGYNFLRSKTTIDFHSTTKKPVLRNDEGIPYVTPFQRYELQLLLMEDILKHGISGQDSSCTISRKLCEYLVKFAFSITAAKRRTLEDMDLYFDNRDGVLVEVSMMEKKQRRKKGLERVLTLPGKLDHVTVVACNIGLVPLTN